MEARARILAGQGRYSEAVEQIDVAMTTIPDVWSLSGVKAYLMSYSAAWNDELGNFEESAKLAETYV